jgi:ABC-type glycerol-3-phosphate transport system permease component
MVAVGHPFVAAIRTMNVPFVVTGAFMISRATVWVRCVDLKHVLVNMIPVHVVQVPLMQVIDVPVMADGFMPAVWPMLMGVASMLLAFVAHHNSSTDESARAPD